MTLVRHLPGSDVAPLPSGLVPLVPDALRVERPDEHLRLLDDRGHVVARCSLWWRGTPSVSGAPTGLVGHFAAVTEEAGRRVLDAGCRRLADEGCRAALGPMDGSVWRSHRLVTWPGTEPAFFLEPTNPPEWPRAFESAGFGVHSSYSSIAVTDLEVATRRAAAAGLRLTRAGVELRGFEPARCEDELARIHALASVVFADGPLYTALSRDEFVARYAALLDRIDPGLVILAEAGARLVGFVFAFPDSARSEPGEPADAVVGKTLACLPARELAGLGLVLTDEVHRRAAARGCVQVVHALQLDGCRANNMSRSFGAVIRRYALFGRALRPSP